MIIKSILALLMIMAMSGCVTNKSHRVNYGEICEYKQRNDCPTAGLTQQTTSQSHYKLVFIEFDDQGFLQSREFKNSAIATVRETVKKSNESGKPVLLLTFIHGWHHNAKGKPEDRDIYRFREELLVKTADTYPDHEVIGVYVGWRGRALSGLLDYLTFWNRKSTAHEVGQNGMTTVLLEIEDAVKGYPVRNEENLMVTIGHSFGGAALFSAVKGVLANRFIQSRPFGTTNEVDGFGDLVLLMNPAFESLQYQSLFELSQYQCLPYPDTQLPKLMVMASPEDYAVRLIFPLGRTPYTLIENHEIKSAQRCKRPLDASETYPVIQWLGDIIAIGHHEAYSSHQLIPRKNKGKNTEVVRDTKSWLEFQKSNSLIIPITQDVELRSYNKTLPNNPYMSIFVEDGLIPGHNDIWGQEIVGFINSMINLSKK